MRLVESRAGFGSGISEYFYKFSPAREHGEVLPSLLDSHIGKGDSVVLSTEEGHCALALGFIVELTPKSVIIGFGRKLNGAPFRLPGFNEETNQIFRGIEDLVERDSAQQKNKNPFGFPETLYRIDKDELTSGMGMVRNNLINLFTVNGDHHRRRLIVDLEPPSFKKAETKGYNIPDPQLNPDQQRAINKVLSGI